MFAYVVPLIVRSWIVEPAAEVVGPLSGVPLVYALARTVPAVRVMPGR